jgi:ectoine hydroxylase
MATLTGPLTDDDLVAWQRDGYLFIKQLFDREEMSLLLKYGRGDERLRGDAYGRRDATGQVTKLALYNHAGDDLYSVFAKSRRVVDRMEQLLADEVYLYHFKMMLKEPRVGSRASAAPGNGTRITATGTTTVACCPTWRVA